ncbi:hypothetical protein [Lunatimonas salinarum]|uniref:hypothetical protein n=1 Tax=Lunatimonas salinarum TaxID=1774590 RepID=UPI001AE04555|nr:hypothetical protein [Lunatimonas salinarum]
MKKSIQTAEWHLIKGLSIEFTASILFVFAFSLFEEEGGIGIVPEYSRPRMGHIFKDREAGR